jgi:DNA replication protein DnaC
MRFAAHAENILFLGPPGVGKTHLAVSLDICAILQGMSVLFYALPTKYWALTNRPRRRLLSHRNLLYPFR